MAGSSHGENGLGNHELWRESRGSGVAELWEGVVCEKEGKGDPYPPFSFFILFYFINNNNNNNHNINNIITLTLLLTKYVSLNHKFSI